MVFLYGSLIGMLVGILVIVGIITVNNLIGTARKSRATKRQQKAIASLPYEQRQYAVGEYWHDEKTGVELSRKYSSFETFSATVALYGGALDKGPELDLTEPDDPFDNDGGFLNADDLDKEQGNANA